LAKFGWLKVRALGVVRNVLDIVDRILFFLAGNRAETAHAFK